MSTASSAGRSRRPTGSDEQPALPLGKYVGAIDQGTSSTRFVLFDHDGNIVRLAQQEIRQIHVDGQPGWAEQDPLEIMSSILSCVTSVLNEEPTIASNEIVAIGITNQRETTVAWSRSTGLPLHNALVWHDTRTAELVTELATRYAEEGGKDHFRESTGLPISTYFSALKMKWLMRHVPAVALAVAEGDCLFGTVDSWVIWKLSGGGNVAARPAHVTDVSNASRTMLMNLRTLQWDERNCAEFDIPLEVLPSIRSNSEVYAHIFEGPLAGVGIAGCVGDQQAAMIGQLCFTEGTAKATYGTGCFMLLNTGSTPVPSAHGLLTTVCFQMGQNAPCVYALEGSVAVAGSAIRWLRDEMGIIKETKEINSLAASVTSANDVYFVPAFSGLLSPYWRDDARGVITGLTHSSNRAHLARAVLNSSAYQTREVLDAMLADTEGRVRLSGLQVDGGMCASEILMQFQADMLSIPVRRPASLEATASGAAFAAGLAVAFWPSMDHLQATMANKPGARCFTPQMAQDEREQLYRGWKKAVQRTFGWIEPKNVEIIPPPKPVITASPPATPFNTTISFGSTRSTPPSTPSASRRPSTSSPSSAAAAAIAAATSSRRVSPVFSHLATLAAGVLIGAAILLRPKQQAK